MHCLIIAILHYLPCKGIINQHMVKPCVGSKHILQVLKGRNRFRPFQGLSIGNYPKRWAKPISDI